MYGKIFESIFDSTLVADGGWLPTYIFMSMVVVADKDGIVDVAPKALFSRLGFRSFDSKICFDEFESAVAYLCQPDEHSKSIAEDGKRLIPCRECDDVETNRGWKIVNYNYYRKKASREDRAKQSTERSKRFRAKKLNENNDETQCNDQGRMQRHTDTDTDIRGSALGSDEPAPSKPKVPHQQIADAYMQALPSLPVVRKITPARRTAIAKIWNEDPDHQDVGWWSRYFGAVSNSKFLTGDNGRGWRADFDFLLKPKTVLGVKEGKYHG